MTHEIPCSWLYPGWPAPANVRAVSTSRAGGVSHAPYDSFNLSSRVGDDPERVAENRARLTTWLRLPSEPSWLRQVHRASVIDAAQAATDVPADAAVALSPGVVCAVLTADCLPVLFCDRDGTRVAAAHAGWRGLLAGVLENTIEALGTPGESLLAWLGPAIGPAAFEVGADVRASFIAINSACADTFSPAPTGRWQADLYQLARLRLAAKGVIAVYGGGLCTYSDPTRFFSYRRDKNTGRMASLIWVRSNEADKSPSNSPFAKGENHMLPLCKEGVGGDFRRGSVRTYKKSLKPFARKLRNNMTDAELLL